MGEHERGDTITEMGDALTEWLRRWIKELREREGGQTDFKIRDATLRTQSADSLTAGEPGGGPSARVSVVLTDRDGVEQEWLLAESWWGGAFRPATFGELAAWAASVGPWLLASQGSGILRRMWGAPSSRGWRRVATFVLKLLMTPIILVLQGVIASVVTPIAFTLLLLSLVPLPFVSDIARGLAQNLAGSFGDLLVLVRSPVRFAAMAERVRTDIAGLDSQCDQVMVVAHSQGSAVAWQAIKRASQQPRCNRPEVALFVSFGQAMRKLKSLYRVHEVAGSMQTRFTLLACVASAILVVVLVTGLLGLGEILGRGGDVAGAIADRDWYWITFVLFVIAGFIVQLWLQAMARANDRESEVELLGEIGSVGARFRDFRWVDLWASADPAPNGPLLADPSPAAAQYVSSYKLRNMASTALDHSVYWSNVTEFVSAIAYFASALTWPNATGVRSLPRLRDAITVRDARVNQLAVARVVFAVGTAFAIAGLATLLPQWGRTVRDLLGRLPFVPNDWFPCCPPPVDGALAAALLAVAALIVWLGLLALWRLPIRGDEAAFFKGRPIIGWDWKAVAWFAAAVAPPILAVAWAAYRLPAWWPAWLYLGGFVAAALIGAAAVVTVLTAGGTRLYDAPGADT